MRRLILSCLFLVGFGPFVCNDRDVERAKEAMKRAEDRLKQKEEIDEAKALAALDRAMMRVQIAERHQAK